MDLRTRLVACDLRNWILRSKEDVLIITIYSKIILFVSVILIYYINICYYIIRLESRVVVISNVYTVLEQELRHRYVENI